MEIRRESTSTIRRLQEILRFCEEGSIVQCYRRDWGTHEISQMKHIVKSLYLNI
jgi:hypothetical protein